MGDFRIVLVSGVVNSYHAKKVLYPLSSLEEMQFRVEEGSMANGNESTCRTR
jgi:hypothetical protein